MGILKSFRRTFNDVCTGISGAAKLVSVTTNGCAATEATYFGKSLQKSTSKLDETGKRITANLWDGKSPFDY